MLDKAKTVVKKLSLTGNFNARGMRVKKGIFSIFSNDSGFGYKVSRGFRLYSLSEGWALF